MAVLKCKMCGGDLEISEGVSVCECEYCGTKQTVPSADNEKKITLFGRANRLRFNNEFDKAAGVYESIVAEFPEEAEAYWGLVLCKYGIEYVDDPATSKKIPTCHRSSFESVMDDSNYEQALENADALARSVYREEAKQIEELRKGIIEVSSKEEPYDIFICYKETAENGDRTIDSVIAQDVYDALTEKGYRVFFSRISLEDKLGVEYEPCIFAALNSAKIMLAFGTDYEYYNAVWVKNEWSRFLKLIAKGEKKTLIPCYKGIDAYDMPKEFAKLQAQDMGKVGAIQDLLRGIEKILPKNIKKAEPVIVQQSAPAAPGVESLLERAFMFLEDGKWEDADAYCDKVLDIDPKCARAYLGKLMADYKIKKQDDFTCLDKSFEKNENFKKINRFDEELYKRLKEDLEPIYRRMAMLRAQTKEKIENSKKAFGIIASGYGHVVGLKNDGTVLAVGDNEKKQCQVADWRNVVAVAAGEDHMIGLKAYGSVVATGYNGHNECDVDNWRNIIALAASKDHTVGLRIDGTVVATGNNNSGQCNITNWKDIISVAAGWEYTIGLRSDGTVEAVGKNDCGQCNVHDWQNIVAISAYGDHTLGLKSDGTVIATGNRNHGKCDVSEWENVIAISAGGMHSVGLCTNGNVISTGNNSYGQCEVGKWKDIVAIEAGFERTVGLCSSGTVLIAGKGEKGENKANEWKLFNNINDLKTVETRIRALKEKAHEAQERRRLAEEARQKRIAEELKWMQEEQRIAEEKQKEEQRIAEEKLKEEQRIAEEKRQQELQLQAERRQKGLCPYCGGEFKRLFSKKCSNCGKPKDY